jgi:hypothetical protein
MRVCSNDIELERYAASAGIGSDHTYVGGSSGGECRGDLSGSDVGGSNERPLVLTRYIVGAKEVEYDGVAARGEIINYA